MSGSLTVIKYLTLEKKCDPTFKKKLDSNTAIHIASFSGHLEVVKFFISELKCDPNIPGQCGYTPLQLATVASHWPIVKYLIEEGI